MAALLCAAAAIFTKETAIVLPVLILAYEVLLGPRLPGETGLLQAKTLQADCCELASFFSAGRLLSFPAFAGTSLRCRNFHFGNFHCGGIFPFSKYSRSPVVLRFASALAGSSFLVLLALPCCRSFPRKFLASLVRCSGRRGTLALDCASQPPGSHGFRNHCPHLGRSDPGYVRPSRLRNWSMIVICTCPRPDSPSWLLSEFAGLCPRCRNV